MKDPNNFGAELKAVGDQLIDIINRYIMSIPDHVVGDCEIHKNGNSQEFKVTFSLGVKESRSGSAEDAVREYLKENPDAHVFFAKGVRKQ